MIETNLDEGKQLLADITELYRKIIKETNEDYQLVENQIERQEFTESAKNLMSYLALRRRDIRSLQYELSRWGLSSLGRLESRTIYTLESVISRLAKIVEEHTEISLPDLEHYNAGQERLLANSTLFFGQNPTERQTSIMVTMPSEASTDLELIKDLMTNGMNVARINCAHDSEDIWLQMINNLKKCAQDLGRDIQILMDIAGPKIRTSWVFSTHKSPQVQRGDIIRMTSDSSQLPSLVDEVKITVGCSIPQIFDKLSEGDPVLIDDGAVELTVIQTGSSEALLKVDRVKGNQVRVKAEKGLNFPHTEFEVNIIDEEDKEAIRFAIEHADIIGCSFIRNAKDIQSIQDSITQMTDRPLNQIKLMLKIETVQAINNLAQVLLQAGSKNPTSVLIARGDLAVESGYVRLAEIQQEIMWLCEASDTPVCWGTEVLATMLNEGIPSRAEVTDAGEGSRAECVMLNKGKYMADTVKMLDQILVKMEEHQYKKTPTLRKLNIAKYAITK